MLCYEYDVEEHTDVPQSQLDRIARYARPVALQVAIDAQLQNREDTPSKVKQDLSNRPALRALILVIREDLRHVLDEGDEELDVGDGIDLCCRALARPKTPEAGD